MGRLRAPLLRNEVIAFHVRSYGILHRSDNSLIRSLDISKLFVPRISPNIASSSGVYVFVIVFPSRSYDYKFVIDLAEFRFFDIKERYKRSDCDSVGGSHKSWNQSTEPTTDR